MPKKCCIPNCRFQSDDPEGYDLSYYKIPADESTKKLWIQNIKKHFDVEFNKWSCVCSLHFEQNCISITEKRAWVKKGCAPTLFAPTRKKYENVKGYVQLCNAVQNIRSPKNNKQHEPSNNLTTDKEMIIAIESGDKTKTVCDTDVALDDKSTTTDKQNNTTTDLLDVSTEIDEYKGSSNSSFHNKSITRIDVDALLNDSDVCTRSECLSEKKKLCNILKMGQTEIIALRKKLKSYRMKTYRAKKKVNLSLFN